MKSRVAVLAVVLFISLAVVAGLHFIARKSAGQANAFNRHFAPDETVHLVKVVNLRGSAYYIAGVDSSHIFLGNAIAQLSVMTFDTAFAETGFSEIRSNISIPGDMHAGRLLVDSPCFYLNDQRTRRIGRGLISDWHVRQLISEKVFIDIAIPLNSQTLAVRTLDFEKMQYYIGKKFQGSDRIDSVSGILENQGDGIFSTDGTMLFSADRSRLVYIYFYRNQFVCMDTNLTVLYRGHSIDTNKMAKLEIVKINAENAYSLAQPPRIVNKSACIRFGKLFIHSLLKADNEKFQTFRTASVIDVYDLSKGDYRVSFYIPDFEHQKLKDFTIFSNKIVAIAGDHLLVFDFDNSLRGAF